MTAAVRAGIGNQMFMISNAIAQGLKHNVPTMFALDTWRSTLKTGSHHGQHMHWEDAIFRKVPKVPTLGARKIIEEETWNTANLNFNLDTSIEFFGYFQSSKNFLGYDSEIRDLFSPNQTDIDRLITKYPLIKDNNTLSVHVRRGDYLTISNYLPPIGISYINEAIKQNGEYSTLFVFSDDKKWVTDNIKHPNIIIVDGNTASDDMWLMSLCTNNIICNSTFSWWGSFLNRNLNKKVYAPSKWGGPRYDSSRDSIYESYWNIIEVEYQNGTLIKK